MRVFTFFTSIGFLATVSCLFTEPKCSKDNGADAIILLPNPEMYFTYWACRGGWAILITCPFGKVFDAFKLSCEDSKTTVCGVDFPTTKSPPPSFSTEKIPPPSNITTVKSFHSSPTTAKPIISPTTTPVKPTAPSIITTVKPTPSTMITVKSTPSSTTVAVNPTSPPTTTVKAIPSPIPIIVKPSSTMTVRPTSLSTMTTAKPTPPTMIIVKPTIPSTTVTLKPKPLSTTTTVIPPPSSSTAQECITVRLQVDEYPVNCPPWYWPSNEYSLLNPKYCYSFYKCIHGTPHLYVRQDNLHFNPELNV